MNMPGFTAEASVYATLNRYLTGLQGWGMNNRVALAFDPTSPFPSPGIPNSPFSFPSDPTSTLPSIREFSERRCSPCYARFVFVGPWSARLEYIESVSFCFSGVCGLCHERECTLTQYYRDWGMLLRDDLTITQR